MTEPDFSAGLIPAIVQDANTGEVLMLAYMNEPAYHATRDTGQAHFWSRSRQQLWKKGETSGNVLDVVDIALDCDADTLLLRVVPAGPTCHTGARTCFANHGNTQDPVGFGRLEPLWATIRNRADQRPPDSYTTALLDGGVDAVTRKVLEESAELVEAALQHDRQAEPEERIAEEAADVVYHLLVLLAERGMSPRRVLDVLAARAR